MHCAPGIGSGGDSSSSTAAAAPPQGKAKPAKVQRCRYFGRGHCRLGDTCPYLHAAPRPKPLKQGGSASVPEPATDGAPGSSAPSGPSPTPTASVPGEGGEGGSNNSNNNNDRRSGGERRGRQKKEHAQSQQLSRGDGDSQSSAPSTAATDAQSQGQFGQGGGRGRGRGRGQQRTDNPSSSSSSSRPSTAAQPRPPAPRARRVCKHRTMAECPRGEQCNFVHEGDPQTTTDDGAMASSAARAQPSQQANNARKPVARPMRGGQAPGHSQQESGGAGAADQGPTSYDLAALSEADIAQMRAAEETALSKLYFNFKAVRVPVSAPVSVSVSAPHSAQDTVDAEEATSDSTQEAEKGKVSQETSPADTPQPPATAEGEDVSNSIGGSASAAPSHEDGGAGAEKGRARETTILTFDFAPSDPDWAFEDLRIISLKVLCLCFCLLGLHKFGTTQ